MAKISKKRFNELAELYRITVSGEKACINVVAVKNFINALNDEVNKSKNKWIRWEGGDCPVAPETKVHVKFRDNAISKNYFARSWLWDRGNEEADIIAYKVVKD